MKLKFLILALAVLTFSCTKTKENTKEETAVEETETAITESIIPMAVIVQNEGSYPREIELFEDPEFSVRFKALVGENYDDIINNFNVESPVVSENGIYKITGCKQHDCPSFHTTILYSAPDDNLNVLINKNGKIQGFGETATIQITETLDAM